MKGIVCGFDLCHSIGQRGPRHGGRGLRLCGVVQLQIPFRRPLGHCRPVGTGSTFAKEPGLAGWWGNRNDTQFELRPEFRACL